jgi:tripartite-type tricarboxylate transporter receptor subunit TctC
MQRIIGSTRVFGSDRNDRAPAAHAARDSRKARRVMARSLPLALLAATALFSTAPANAAEYPDKPVKIIAPFAPGGTADTLGRIAAEHLTRQMHQQFYVENRAGGGGLIGAAAVATADPDGYTLGVSSIASHVIAPALSPNPPFDSMRDFSHIAYLGGPPLVVVVHPSLGVSGWKDLVALARKSPDGLNYVSSGTGTHGHLFAEYLAHKENIKLNHVPYKGSAPAMTDLIGGHVKIGAMALSSAIEQMRAGKVKAVALSSENRVPDFPDVPTFKELGYPDLVAATWFSLSGPAKMPKEIVQRLNDEVEKMLRLPEVKQQMAREGAEIRFFTSEQFTKFVGDEIAMWRPIAKKMAPTN